MAGSYCQYCDRRCFVSRQVIVAGQLVWAGHMATCERGKEHDRNAIGMDSTTAHNPVWDECPCALCKPAAVGSGGPDAQ